jgi:hypothetical protein
MQRSVPVVLGVLMVVGCKKEEPAAKPVTPPPMAATPAPAAEPPAEKPADTPPIPVPADNVAADGAWVGKIPAGWKPTAFNVTDEASKMYDGLVMMAPSNAKLTAERGNVRVETPGDDELGMLIFADPDDLDDEVRKAQAKPETDTVERPGKDWLVIIDKYDTDLAPVDKRGNKVVYMAVERNVTVGGKVYTCHAGAFEKPEIQRAMAACMSIRTK